MELEGKVALVTGGSRGIGRATVIELAKRGCNVAFFYYSREDKAREVEEEAQVYNVKVKGYKVDVSDFNSVKEGYQQARKDFGPIDILVNNAGIISRTYSIFQIQEEEWDQIINVNLKGAFNVTRLVVGDMKEKKQGSIVNVASIAGKMGGNVGVHYAASKAGLIGMTFSLARELAQYNINVNAVAPGPVDTDMMKDVTKERLKIILSGIPLKRMATAEEVARAIVFLIENDYITGEVVDINGGSYMD